MIIAGKGPIFNENPIRCHLKAMIVAGKGENFNENHIQSHLKAVIIAGRVGFSVITLSRAI